MILVATSLRIIYLLYSSYDDRVDAFIFIKDHPVLGAIFTITTTIFILMAIIIITL